MAALVGAACGRSADGAHAGHGAAGEAHKQAEVAFLFPDGDDRGWSSLMNAGEHAMAPPVPLALLPAPTRAQLIRQLALTAEVSRKYPTIRDAEAAGYRRVGPFMPGLGTHYIGGGRTIEGDVPTDEELLRPMSIIYDGLSPDSPVAGVMYSFTRPAGGGTSNAPEGFAGPNDQWHAHRGICLAPPRADGTVEALGGDGSITEADCRAQGGTYRGDAESYALHVWTSPAYTNPLGVFAHLNPAITCPDGTYRRSQQDIARRCLP